MENQIIDENEEVKDTLELPKKKRVVNYVQTDARKEAFEKARLTRKANIELKQKEKDELEKLKQIEVKDKILKKAAQIQKKELKEKKVIEKYIDPDSSDSEPEIIIQKVKKNKRKKVIVVQDEYTDDEPEVRQPIKTYNRRVVNEEPTPFTVRFI
jgi:hypothetical protein